MRQSSVETHELAVNTRIGGRLSPAAASIIRTAVRDYHPLPFVMDYSNRLISAQSV
jgi:hypothetical protein